MAAITKVERKMRNTQTLAGKICAGLLLAVCAALVLPGCQNPLQPSRTPGNDTETGTLLLTVSRQGEARTILPIWPEEIGDFVQLTLVFTSVYDDNQSRIIEDWVPGTPIELYAGTWSLHVSAYLPGDWGTGEGNHLVLRPAFEGGHPGIAVLPGGTVSGNVTLSPIATGGSGTFRWNLGFDANIVAVSMEILRDNLSPHSGPFFLLHDDSAKVTLDNPGYLVMGAGRYLVVFTLYDDRGESMTDSRTLRIYRNMCSSLDYTFSGPPVSPLYFVLDAWNPTTGTWNFFEHGIDAWFFRTFLSASVGGITDDNFDDIVRWFDYLTTNDTVPINEAELRSLVDAALVGIAGDDETFTRATNLWTQACATGAIIDTAVNVALSTDDFDWTAGYYTVTVSIGVHNVQITFVPVPVTGVTIYGPSTRILEETLYLHLSASIAPYDARYQGIRWEIPNEDERAFVALYHDEAVGMVRVTGLSAGEAVIHAASMADPTNWATVTVEVFPYGAGVPITGIEILNDTITLEVGEYEDLVIQLTPHNTTQPDFTFVSSAAGIATVAWEYGRSRVRAVSVGNATITVRSTVNPALFDTVEISVNATPTGVIVEPSTANVPLDGTLQFTHTVQGPEGVSQDVTWTVRPEDAATIAGGLLTLTGATVNQELTVMATAMGTVPPVYGYATVTVIAPEPTDIMINPHTPTIIRGGYPQQFTATVLPAGATQNVEWGVDPQPAGVSISTTGLLVVGGTTVTGGTVLTITAAIPSTGLTATATVTVVVTPTSVTMNPYTPTMIRGGEPQQFTATVLPAGTPQDLAWSVYPEPAGVSISATGLLAVDGTTVTDGTALTVTAAVPGTSLTATATVTVIVIPTSVTMNPYTPTMIRGGYPQQFTVTVTPAGILGNLLWSVYPEPAGVSISQTGLLTVGGSTITDGTTLIVTATVPGTSLIATATVTVAVTPTGVTMNPYTPTMIRGSYPQQFTATVLPAGAPQNLAWSVYPEPAGVSISASGLLAVDGTTVNHGATLTVTATVPGTSLTATATITVIVTPTGVSVMPGTANVPRGGTQQFAATVLPTDAPQNVIWTVYPETGGTLGDTVINQQGWLTVGAGASGALIVRATADGHPAATGTATVTIPDDITWTATAVGSPTTTAIDLVFSSAPAGLLASDITITPDTGSATAGTLSGTGTTLTLAVYNVYAGIVYVSINRLGITGGTQPVTLVAPAPGEGGFSISFADFRDIETESTGPTVSILGGPQTITVTYPEQYDLGSIRWFLEGIEIAPTPGGPVSGINGGTLTLDYRVHGNQIRTHRVTVVVRKDDVPYSKLITFTVVP